MPKAVHPIIETLFASPGPMREPVAFEWRLIRRKRRPFLLLSLEPKAARTGMTLYSAQRRRARIWRSLLPMLFQTPAARLFKRVRFSADASSEVMQFLAQQAGVPAGQAFPTAIKLSEVGLRSRLVLLVCDESGRPARVIKAGLNTEGRQANNREADFLAQLPPHTIGCLHLTGRLTTSSISAFATDYFPGASPSDDAGMEHLFHVWLNPGPPVPLASLPLWSDLAAVAAVAEPEVWQTLSVLLAKKCVRTTLYHGDFAPWNIRTINSRNLEAFDWERGSLHGIPGWDWFHFTTQTAILARRCSIERVAAEVEQLIHSPRFKKYASEAEIGDLVQPLLLAYLLHQRWVIKPVDGRQEIVDLFKLLSEHWQIKPGPAAVAAPVPPIKSASGLLLAAWSQLKSAVSHWSNLFWEPQLNSNVPPPLVESWKIHWPVILLANLLLAGVAVVQYFSSGHLMFPPFYLCICALVTWKTDRRWGVLVAALAALARPLMEAAKDPDYQLFGLGLWNTAMRFVVLGMCVLFVDRIRKQRDFFHRHLGPDWQPAPLKETWAVILASVALLTIVAGLDWLSDPHMTFMPLYLFPCMLIALALNWRWSLMAVVLAAFLGTFIEHLTNNGYSAKIFGWNFAMRFTVYLLVLGLLNRIRRKNILFGRRKTNGS